jgi:hypothetical protein
MRGGGTVATKKAVKKATRKAQGAPRASKPDMAERNRAIVEALKGGTPAAEVAKKYGLSQIRVKQIAWQVKTGRVKLTKGGQPNAA